LGELTGMAYPPKRQSEKITTVFTEYSHFKDHNKPQV